MRGARIVAALIALAFVVSGCGQEPKKITGTAAPITAPAGSPTSTPIPSVLHYYPAEPNSIISLRVPQGWTERDDPNSVRVDFIDPTGMQLLRLDSTPFSGGNAYQNWEDESKDFAKTAQDYQEIGIHSVTCPPGAKDCADWEFTFRSTSDERVRHVIDRAFVTNGDQGVALYYSAPEEIFSSSSEVLDYAAQTMKFLR